MFDGVENLQDSLPDSILPLPKPGGHDHIEQSSSSAKVKRDVMNTIESAVLMQGKDVRMVMHEAVEIRLMRESFG